MSLFTGVLLLILLLWGCGGKDNVIIPQRIISAVTVDAEKAMQEAVETVIETVGSLEAAEDIKVSAKISGRVREILFEEGDPVKKDQLLMVLDDEMARLQKGLSEKKKLRQEESLKRAEAVLKIKTAAVPRFEAEVRRTQALQDYAKSHYERKKALYQQGAATEAVLQSAEADYESAAAALDVAKAALSEAKGAVEEAGAAVAEAKQAILEAEEGLKIAEEQLDETRIKAPFTGRLGERYVGPGEFVDSGDRLVRLVTMDPLKASFTVPERYRNLLEVGLEISLTTDATKDRFFKGKVIFISPGLDESTRSVRAKAVVNNPERLLQPGYFCHVRLILNTNPKAVVIPEEAVVPRGDTFFVYTVEEEKACRKEVRLGQRMAGRVEILNGIEADEMVITAGHQRVADGSLVKIRVRENGPAQGGN